MKSLPTIPKSTLKTMQAILAVPTAPFHEKWMREAVISRVRNLDFVKNQTDVAGNLKIRYRHPQAKKVHFAFQAHLDHPGYVLQKQLKKGLSEAEALGGVGKKPNGGTLRFYPTADSPGISARVVGSKTTKKSGWVRVSSHTQIPKGSIGMWNFPPLRERGVWIESRSLDDTLGVAAILSLLEKVSRKKIVTAFEIILTRAEEVGFEGAIEMLRKPSWPLPPIIVTIEMPGAYGELKPGDGVILRVGDRLMTFDPGVQTHIEEHADKLQKRHSWFKAQKRLGHRGRTESSLFQLHGKKAGSLCLPVVNPHNADIKSGSPAPERVHRGDFISLLALMEVLVTSKWDLKASADKKLKMIQRPKSLKRERLYQM